MSLEIYKDVILRRRETSQYHRVCRLYVGMAPTRPLNLKKSNGLELPKSDVLSLLDKKHALRVLLYTIILSNIVKYTRTAIFGKLKKRRLFIIFFSLLQFKRPTAKLGIVIALFLSRKSFTLERP